MKQCANGHFYDENRFAECPYCDGGPTAAAPSSDDVGKTVAAAPVSDDIGKTVAAAPAGNTDAGKTVAFMGETPGFDPVVGYLIIADGPQRGADFRLHVGRNFIGRSTDMDISLSDDETVFREGHAVISYDERSNHFRIFPGTSRGLAYLNGKEVDAATELAAYDLIEVGHTTLVFLPLCGERFMWA